jgi:hypothetical protein
LTYPGKIRPKAVSSIRAPEPTLMPG